MLRPGDPTYLQRLGLFHFLTQYYAPLLPFSDILLCGKLIYFALLLVRLGFTCP